MFPIILARLGMNTDFDGTHIYIYVHFRDAHVFLLPSCRIIIYSLFLIIIFRWPAKI